MHPKGVIFNYEMVNKAMRKFFGSVIGKICIAVLILLVLGGAAFGGYQIWLYQQPKFHDLTVELGTPGIGMSQFTTQYAKLSKTAFVSDVTKLDISKVGQYQLVLSHGGKEEHVVLTVEDTTPPEVVFVEHRTELTGYEPKPEDFIETATDLAAMTISFDGEVTVPENYDDMTFTVQVADASGNVTEKECGLSFEWLKESFVLEFGQELTKTDLLLNPEKDEALIDQTDIDQINQEGVGEYTILSATTAKSKICTVTVQDTTGPELKLQDVPCYKGNFVDWHEFVVSATDLSGKVELRLMNELDFYTEGEQEITIEAEDIYGNVSSATATFIVSTDMVPPTISGLSAMLVEKHSTPNYLDGVSAMDSIDGACKVTYDDSKVDLTKAGVYYVTYYASDKSGNRASARRKVEVNHNQEDTQALVNELAATLSSDPEALRNYVRSHIGYSSNWGGADPVWFGFKNWTGNCYVHAMCLDSLLKIHGYETQLIWTTCKTHYWLLIKLNGVWKHIDPTPSSIHSRYSLMTDEQRLSTLSGRSWDTTLWPACE